MRTSLCQKLHLCELPQEAASYSGEQRPFKSLELESLGSFDMTCIGKVMGLSELRAGLSGWLISSPT